MPLAPTPLAQTTLRLVTLSGVQMISLAINPNAASLLTLDLGYPAARTNTTVLSDADGVLDSTRFAGGRGITAEIDLHPAVKDELADQLSGYIWPGLRYYLYVQRPGWASERRIMVRGDTWAIATRAPWTAQLGFQSSAGAFEDSVVSSQVLSPGASGAEGGLAFRYPYPKTYGVGVVPGFSYVTVGGTVPTPPVIDIYGPCTSPSIELVDTGQVMAFPGLVINAGDFMEITTDPAVHSIYLNADPTRSLYGYLNFAVSQWWVLPPGAQQLLFSPTQPGAGCRAVVSWRNRTIAA